MDIIWDGVTRPESLNEELVKVRTEFADVARTYDWKRVFEILSVHPELVNVSRLGSKSLYTPLHQAAHGGAPIEVAKRLIELGAWRTTQNATGERPVDVAMLRNHYHLLPILKPEYSRQVPLGILLKIQSHFHQLIDVRAGKFIEEHSLRLPELEPLLEVEKSKFWFPVPGMYGGFSYLLMEEGVNATLVVESWCRVADGSGQRHEITSSGSKLREEGFV